MSGATGTESDLEPVSVVHGPAPLSAVVAVGVALAAVVLVVADAVRPALLVEAVALALCAAGVTLYRRSHGVVGACVTGVGVVGALAALPLAVELSSEVSVLVAFVPGAAGIAAVAAAVLPVTGSGSRGLLKAGAAGVFASVVLVGLFRGASLLPLLAGTAGAVLAWDAGEHAINVGEQLGRGADTARGELVHVGGSTVVAAGTVLVGSLLDGVALLSLSFPALVLVLIAAILLTAALHD